MATDYDDRRIEEEVNGVYTTPKQNPSETQGSAGGGVSESGTGGSGAINASVLPNGQGAPLSGSAEVAVPVHGTRNRDMLGDYKDPYSKEDLKKAQKRGRRESRMATAGHIMDTMARLFNYGATVNGGPSAHWANRNVEVDPNTYYAKLKGANDKARQDYINMALKAGKADNDEYQTDINLYDKQKKWKDKEDERNANQPGREADARKKNAEARAKEIENENAPERIAGENKERAARIRHYNAESAKAAEGLNDEFQIYAGNGQFRKYNKAQKAAYEQDVYKTAKQLGIPFVEEYEKIVEEDNRFRGTNKTTTEQRNKAVNQLAGEIWHKLLEMENGI